MSKRHVSTVLKQTFLVTCMLAAGISLTACSGHSSYKSGGGGSIVNPGGAGGGSDGGGSGGGDGSGGGGTGGGGDRKSVV